MTAEEKQALKDNISNNLLRIGVGGHTNVEKIQQAIFAVIDELPEGDETGTGGGSFKGVYADGQKQTDTYWLSGNIIWRVKQDFTSAAAPTVNNAWWEAVLQIPSATAELLGTVVLAQLADLDIPESANKVIPASVMKNILQNLAEQYQAKGDYALANHEHLKIEQDYGTIGVNGVVAPTVLDCSKSFHRITTSAVAATAFAVNALNNLKFGETVTYTIDSKQSGDSLSGLFSGSGSRTITLNGVANTVVSVRQVGSVFQPLYVNVLQFRLRSQSGTPVIEVLCYPENIIL